jgi:hypothetical protein
MISHHSTRFPLALILALAAIGCSRSRDDLPREPVAGTVTMDGKPLPEGTIQFYPTGDASKTALVGENAEIKEGGFSIPREDGLIPGTYKVSISHAELKEAKPKVKTPPLTNTSIPSRTKELGPELIPARYNTKSELKAEIPRGGTKDLKFGLQSK